MEWIIKKGDFMRPSKGDYIVPLDDCMRIFNGNHSPEQKREECDKLYEAWEQSKKVDPSKTA